MYSQNRRIPGKAGLMLILLTVFLGLTIAVVVGHVFVVLCFSHRLFLGGFWASGLVRLAIFVLARLGELL